MLVTLLLCLLLCAALGVFVVAPLARAGFESAGRSALKGFTDEEELRQALLLRDALFARLVEGSSSEPAVSSLSEIDAMNALVALCERLRNADFPFLPSDAPVKVQGGTTPSSPSAPSPALAALLGVTLCGTLAWGGIARAQPMAPVPATAPEQAPSGQGDGSANGGVQNAGDPGAAVASHIPGAITMDGMQWAPLHQYVLSPRMGQLHVYYLGVFNNAEGLTEARMGLPFPEGFEELKFSKMPDAVVEPSAKSYPVVRMPLKPGVNQIRGEFVLEAPTGVADWKATGLPALPGTMVVLMPEYSGVIRSITEGVFPSLNVWPPRIVGMPADFRSEVTKEEYDPTDPNFEMLIRMPPEYTRNAVRSSPQPAAFPRFEIVGIVPTRAPLYVLGALFASFLFGTAAFTMSRHARAGRDARVLSKA